jgi:general secretion pathway protein F
MTSDNEPKPDEPTIPEPSPPGGNKAAETPAAPKGALSLEDFILLNEEIAGMAKAGLPLDQGLAALAAEMGEGRLGRVTGAIAVDLKAGFTLPEAVDRQAGRVPAFYARLLTAGIRSGKIGDVISTMTVYARTQADLRNTVLSALLYPCIVLILSLMLFTAVSFYIAPLYKSIFDSFRIKTPWATEMMFFITDHGVWFFLLLPLSVLILMLLVRLWLYRTTAGRTSWARSWYAVPIVGAMLRSARLAAFSDLLGILVDNNVPLPEAFLLAGQSSSDPIMAEGAQRVHGGLTQGMPLGTALRGRTLVPEMVAWMVGLGETRGTLGPTLHQIGEMYRRQVEMRASMLRSVLPPLLVIFVAGFVVVLFILCLMLPLLSLFNSFMHF